MIVGLLGGQGAHKTASAVYLAYYEFYLNGYIIVTNIDVTFPHIPFEKEMLFSEGPIDGIKEEYGTNKVMVIIDEAELILHSHFRDSESTFFITQARKMLEGDRGGGHLIWITQRYNQVNKWLRNNTSLIIYVDQGMDEEGTEFISWEFMKESVFETNLPIFNQVLIEKSEIAKAYPLYNSHQKLAMSKDYKKKAEA